MDRIEWTVFKLRNAVIRFRIEQDLKDRFEMWCYTRNTDPSKELRKFIINIIDPDFYDP